MDSFLSSRAMYQTDHEGHDLGGGGTRSWSSLGSMRVKEDTDNVGGRSGVVTMADMTVMNADTDALEELFMPDGKCILAEEGVLDPFSFSGKM